MEDWAEIRRLHRAEQVPIKQIARVMGISRNTMRLAPTSTAAPIRMNNGASGSGCRSRRVGAGLSVEVF